MAVQGRLDLEQRVHFPTPSSVGQMHLVLDARHSRQARDVLCWSGSELDMITANSSKAKVFQARKIQQLCRLPGPWIACGLTIVGPARDAVPSGQSGIAAFGLLGSDGPSKPSKPLPSEKGLINKQPLSTYPNQHIF